MNLYLFFETTLIVLIGVFSLYQVLKLLMPRSIRATRDALAETLARGARSGWRQALAGRLRDNVPVGGCGAGCGDRCNDCSLARGHPPLAGDDKSPH